MLEKGGKVRRASVLSSLEKVSLEEEQMIPCKHGLVSSSRGWTDAHVL